MLQCKMFEQSPENPTRAVPRPCTRNVVRRGRSQDGIPEAYAGRARQAFSAAPQQPAEVTTVKDVAEAVWMA